MCSKGIACLSQSVLHYIIYNHQPYSYHQAVYLMDSPVTTPHSVTGSTPCFGLASGSNDETPRVKLLCSFLGSILPRPQDGKLRYVGGETRILSLPRDITYEELMNRMRELYEGAAVLKYQQPDEDLDALVSVVNDDDVTNMMEEYEKLGSGDGFTRLRIFLFSHPEQDASSSPYVDGDERETERRYVDALNNLNDGADYRKQQNPDSPVIGPVDDIHLVEQFFNQISLEGGLHSHRNSEMPIPHYNLHHLKIPQMGTGQHQQPVPQRYNDTEGQWSPAYYSPMHPGHHDARAIAEFPSSPSSARYRMPFGEIPDKGLDRMPEEVVRQQLNHHPNYDHQPQFSENLVWMPSDKPGFPGHIIPAPNVLEGNSVCDHCRVTFQRNQTHLEQPNIGNGLPQVANFCAECPPNRETLMLNADAKPHHMMYPKDQNDHRSVYGETHSNERGWVLQHPLNPCVEDTRTHVSGAGRLNDHYFVDGVGMNIPLGHGNIVDGHHLPPNYVHHRAGPELGNEVFHDHNVAVAPHLPMAPPEEQRGVRYGNITYAYGADNLYPVSHGHVPGQSLWRNAQNPMHGGPSFEASTATHLVNGTVNTAYLRSTLEGHPRFGMGVDNQIPWVESSQKLLGTDGAASAEYSFGHTLKLNPTIHIPDNPLSFIPDPIRSPHGMLKLATPMEAVQRSASSSTLIHENMVPSAASNCNPDSRNNNGVNEAVSIEETVFPGEEKEANHVVNDGNSEVPSISCAEPKKPSHEPDNLDYSSSPEESGNAMKVAENDPCALHDDSNLFVDRFIPELIASIKKAALEEAEEVKAIVEENSDGMKHESKANTAIMIEPEAKNAHGEEVDSDNENLSTSTIEPTKAEAEAIAKGLQTIKNSDLEEIRELGSGTYGAVYHGKWKGSDVAIKRIKASCFAGRPSERERLIADFWKEALILSSLHHPNVVSLYGIVRDGLDGSLATVTEFMINGSLKQFLQKKDRTIDRRKRLIIAMDAAFGMEYLHGKNIVHFDLKCENLLVNMRDPQRPICKIGDLGLSKVKQHTLVSGGVRGTLPWMAPELLSGKSNMVTEKIDVYSFGIVMWELLTGNEPYADMHCASIIGGIVNNSLRPQIPTWCDPEWKSLMESCWASDPAERPSFSEISQKLRNMAAAINVK
ncbi:PB1 domain-containing protein/Pkinase_Tyr domain-containing protein [Cephalotus follicularis]|uniref:PB1 domain-containing protein/Pkinase_Tyr domain-containing protein n=1 Tax=Cephalotus follicularis TaxID=3775 RepID=A0A1Q3AV57_CEPFO|nr:PB1 domain-containing protein/Pkinase_Tyr domain-containing protein [Cephalotus follicularis]